METLVVDASSLVDWLMEDGPRADKLSELLDPASLAGPPHLLIEASNALKNLSTVRSRNRIEEAFDALTSLRLTTIDFSVFARLAWHYRHNLSLYDASYLATALITGYPLVTSDRRLATVARETVQVVEL